MISPATLTDRAHARSKLDGMGGFSVASVVLSYFLVAGGTFLTTLLAARLGIHNQYLGYLIMAVGGLFGGLLSARASTGSTIVEPAVGSVLMVGSLFALGLGLSDEAGRQMLLLPSSIKELALTGGASAGGGVVGAFLAERLFGSSSASSGPFIIYAMLASFGAGVIGTIFGFALGKGEAGVFYGIIAICCLLVGLASGALARTRPLLATLVGGAIGVFGFFLLAVIIFVAILAPMTKEEGIPAEVYIGLAIVSLGAGIVTMIGATIGWATVGKKAATAPAA